MANTAQKLMTQAEFLEWEERQPERHEYDRGVIRAMTGGTLAHDRVRLNIASSLHRQLGGKPCRAHLNVRVVCPNGNVRYPDVAVDCGPYDPKALALSAPALVVEVLSPSTQATDYIVKVEDYGSVETIQTYWLASADEPRIDVIERVGGRLKLIATIEGLDAGVSAPDLGVALAFAEIYG
ncbi:MAG: Uma2 family endonuclease [Rhizobiaceae bacterium]|nr:Uma2 family endonuclease [Rhizobiaceae bacterium]